ncbi:lipopolysaccharide biosynthesis protein [Fibrisoma montanum]|uniref:Lipopolysaccharide biosynthesis protein n=1 Tax=Fibrisoma montanum TaxID=2305895 RepID=A0A418MIG3_9BACT|nr:lipopolysaccharide biosynthesis protein [Fibrisoma montanum]RIV27121.1 lipopolysaccharide biosynthesis protein [Fibrisoma montanum]
MGIIKRQTIQGTIFTYAGIVVGFVTMGLLLPKVLTPDQNGLIGLLIALSIILTQFSNLGINGAGGRYFPYFRNYDQGHGGFLLLAAGVSLLGFGLSVFILWSFRPYIVAENAEKSALFVQYYYLLIPLTFFTLFFNLFDNYAKLLYDSVTGTFLQQFLQRFLLLLAVLIYWAGWITFPTLLILWMGSYFAQMALMVVKVVRDGHFTLDPKHLQLPPDLRRELFRYASLTLLTGLSSQVILHIDKYLVNDALGLAQTGIYSISANFGTVIAAPATMLYKVSSVVIADSWKANDLNNIANIYRKSCLSQLVIGTLVFVGIAANLPSVFEILPKGYEAGYYVILWIGLGKLIDMATGVNGTILATSRYYAYDSLFFILMVAVTIATTRALIPVFGLEGAAIGAAIATALFNAARTGFVWLKFGLQPFTWRNLAVIGVGLLVWVVAVQAPYLSGNFWLVATDVALRSAFVAATFVGLVYVLKISPDMNQLLTGAWLKRRGKSVSS